VLKTVIYRHKWYWICCSMSLYFEIYRGF